MDRLKVHCAEQLHLVNILSSILRLAAELRVLLPLPAANLFLAMSGAESVRPSAPFIRWSALSGSRLL